MKIIPKSNLAPSIGWYWASGEFRDTDVEKTTEFFMTSNWEAPMVSANAKAWEININGAGRLCQWTVGLSTNNRNKDKNNNRENKKSNT